ncbi:MAG TPA: DUF6064 family protein [Burkholderiaceae bacterium]|nr:DUF6064 family protein [Burkholderiaceae bacterium]
MLPFTRDEFMAVFNTYNSGVWPVQIVAYALGLAVVAALWRSTAAASRFIAAALGAMWVWTGVAYHALHFSAINTAAWAFGALFVVQGVALCWIGGVRGRLRFARGGGAAAWIGALLIGYAMVAYPLIGIAAGHHPTELPMFGITPCPLTIFTFGVLLWATPPVSWWLLAVPLAWSLIGGSAAFLLRVPQDWLLLGSGIVTAALLHHGRSHRVAARPRGAAG